MRIDKRKNDELRQVTMTRNYIDSAPGSVLVEFGKTKVVCTAMIEDKVPSFLKEKRQGWITAEYGMLPGATQDRMTREATRGKQSGRTMEIQRLVGRSLRAVVDLKGLGSRTIRIDCDVIQADGGTRTSAVTGSMVALYDAVQTLLEDKKIKAVPITYFIAAVSVGIVRGSVMLDLCYEEDSSADVDMNVVMTDKGRFVELQGTAEQKPFEPAELAKMIDVGKKGIKQLIAIQKKVLKIK